MKRQTESVKATISKEDEGGCIVEIWGRGVCVVTGCSDEKEKEVYLNERNDATKTKWRL